MEENKPIKLNLGSGKKRVNGFISVDAFPYEEVDIVCDLTEVPYDFAQENSVDEISSIEFLEHISFRQTLIILKEWCRILKPKGKLYLQVPAIDKMCEMFVNNEVCDCVPHKPIDNANADKNCVKCKGNGKVHPNRWLYAFTGAQKHDFDYHQNVFTKDILTKNLFETGFSKVDVGYDKYNWKLIARCQK